MNKIDNKYVDGDNYFITIVAINDIFSLKWGHYGPKEDNLDHWETIICWFIILLYPIKR